MYQACALDRNAQATPNSSGFRAAPLRCGGLPEPRLLNRDPVAFGLDTRHLQLPPGVDPLGEQLVDHHVVRDGLPLQALHHRHRAGAGTGGSGHERVRRGDHGRGDVDYPAKAPLPHAVHDGTDERERGVEVQIERTGEILLGDVREDARPRPGRSASVGSPKSKRSTTPSQKLSTNADSPSRWPCWQPRFGIAALNPHERPFTGMLDRHPRSAAGGCCLVSAGRASFRWFRYVSESLPMVTDGTSWSLARRVPSSGY